MKRTIMWPPLFYSFISSDSAASSLIRAFQVVSHFSWELPQQLLGFLMGLFLLMRGTINPNARFFKGVLFIETSSFKKGCGVSLGYIVIHGPDSPGSLKQHEFGHCIQSRVLGPFYLLLIGVPSFLWATGWSYGNLHRIVNYDAFFIERSATNLGRKYGDGV
ncbi:MAG TPA: hypothetical protein VH107_16665 [Lacipirellulaceae bacterium]|nr:hypothetical protein [Lacipirellulaceae bacterium]